MRIGCYGFVAEKSGSLASANYLMLEELLRQGHSVDFYAIKGFIYPQGFLSHQSFRYYGVEVPAAGPFWRAIEASGPLRNHLAVLFSIFSNCVHYVAIKKQVALAHKKAPYDVFLFLGLPSFFRVRGLVNVSWLQGAPYLEAEAIRNNRSKIVSLCGWAEYLILRSYYFIRDRNDYRDVRKSDFLIVCSGMTRDHLQKTGIDPSRVSILPYPIDAKLFPYIQRPARSPRTILYLGRIVPRKRLDLLLESFRLILRERDDVVLKIIGRFSYGKGYRALLLSEDLKGKVDYAESVERSAVHKVMASADVLVQPSENEIYGNSVVEAVLTGLPCVVGPTNGTLDHGGRYLFLADNYDPVSFKEAVLRSLGGVNDPGLEEWTRIRERLSVRRVSFELSEILKSMSSRKNAAG
jgi:glycosyltransferase involved in cell wall biosynthesis